MLQHQDNLLDSSPRCVCCAVTVHSSGGLHTALWGCSSSGGLWAGGLRMAGRCVSLCPPAGRRCGRRGAGWRRLVVRRRAAWRIPRTASRSTAGPRTSLSAKCPLRGRSAVRWVPRGRGKRGRGRSAELGAGGNTPGAPALSPRPHRRRGVS